MNSLLTCWLTRRIIPHRVDDHLLLPGWARLHVEHCGKCRRCYELEMEIVRQLSVGSDQRKMVPGPFLHSKIMRAINEERAGDNRLPASSQWGWSMGLL